MTRSPRSMRHPYFAIAFALPALAFMPNSAISAPAANPILQDWASVDRQTQNVAKALGRTAAPIDRRIKLAQCPEQPTITAMSGGSLAVRCTPLGWRLRVAMIEHGSRSMQQDHSDFFAAPAPAAAPQRAAATPPLIRRGDVVRISIDTPNFSVSYPATAIQDGRMGDAISLRGADPKNPILAVVAGPGRAIISR